jgi:hypothetical protein
MKRARAGFAPMVEHDQVDLLTTNECKSTCARRHLPDLVHVGEEEREDFLNGHIVVDHQDLRRHPGHRFLLAFGA